MRTTITLDDETAAEARSLGVNLSAAARAGIAEAVRRARATNDRRAYEQQPESDTDDWVDVRSWNS